MDYVATCGVRHVKDAPREARHSEGLLVLAQKNYHKAGALSFTKKEYFIYLISHDQPPLTWPLTLIVFMVDHFSVIT